MAIWTEKDIWEYIERFGIKIADIYNTGIGRTGCAACGFGCQFKDDIRFKVLKELHPKYYDMVMNFENNGVKYKDALQKVLDVKSLKLP